MRATVTWCSCIASSREDWVFGVARLISSASTRLAKIGPGWNLKTRLPPSSTRMLVPVMSAGMRSGVNWIRLNVQSMTSRDRPDEHRLAQSRDALEQHVAVREEADEGVADEVLLADDDLADLGLDAPGALGERLGGEALVPARSSAATDASMGPPGWLRGGAGPAAHGLGSSELK